MSNLTPEAQLAAAVLLGAAALFASLGFFFWAVSGLPALGVLP